MDEGGATRGADRVIDMARTGRSRSDRHTPVIKLFAMEISTLINGTI